MIMKIIIFMTEILFITLSAFTGGPRVLLETLSQMIIGETIVVAPPSSERTRKSNIQNKRTQEL